MVWLLRKRWSLVRVLSVFSDDFPVSFAKWEDSRWEALSGWFEWVRRQTWFLCLLHFERNAGFLEVNSVSLSFVLLMINLVRRKRFLSHVYVKTAVLRSQCWRLWWRDVRGIRLTCLHVFHSASLLLLLSHILFVISPHLLIAFTFSPFVLSSSFRCSVLSFRFCSFS